MEVLTSNRFKVKVIKSKFATDSLFSSLNKPKFV